MPPETTPLLGERRSKRSVKAYLQDEVSPEWTDSVLLVGCLATGLLDSAVFNVWSCFVSMQTGNTVYVGLGLTGQPYSQPTRWIKSGTSILGFMLGSFIFSRLMTRLSSLRRSTLLIASASQAVLTLIPALLSQIQVVPAAAGHRLPQTYIVLLPLTLLALQSGGQCVLSRVLGYGEIPTVVLTSAYCDFAMDPKLFSGIGSNPKRNRRFSSVIMLILGAWLGGLLTRTGEIANALWAVGGIKIIMTLIWLVWPEKAGVRLED